MWGVWGGGRSPVVRASELQSEDAGFVPRAAQGERHSSYQPEATLVQTCSCMTPIRVYGTARQAPIFVRTLNIPYPPVVKE